MWSEEIWWEDPEPQRVGLYLAEMYLLLCAFQPWEKLILALVKDGWAGARKPRGTLLTHFNSSPPSACPSGDGQDMRQKIIYFSFFFFKKYNVVPIELNILCVGGSAWAELRICLCAPEGNSATFICPHLSFSSWFSQMQRWVWCETCKKWEARDEVINLSDVIQMDSICLSNKGAINNMSEHQFLLWGWALSSRERPYQTRGKQESN